jgi:hypothetical protein
MITSLLDLCTKGIVSVQEIKDNHKTHYQFTLEKPDKVKELEPINKEIIRFFFEEVANSNVVLNDKDLKDFATRNSNSFQVFLQNLFKQTRDWWEKTLGTRLIDPISSTAYNKFLLYILPAIVVGEIMLGIGLAALLGVPGPVSVVIPFMSGVFIFIIFLFAGRSILRWSAPAYQEQKRWQNFRRFLTDFSAIKQAPITLLPIWEHYFVYAVVLGVAQKFLKNITNLALEQKTAIVLPVWYVAAGGTKSITSFAESISHFESFASNFTGMMNSFSTSVATGGGFSGGGGGGGGGGSSGAG